MADESNPRRELRSFNPEQATSIVRWIIIAAGAFMTARGYLTKEQVSSLTDVLSVGIPAVIAMAAGVWGVVKKSDANIMASAASVPAVDVLVTSPQIANEVLKKEPKVVDAMEGSILMAERRLG